jgi:hypothetical protein
MSEMSPERLAEIRRYWTESAKQMTWERESISVRELLAHIDHLTAREQRIRQLEQLWVRTAEEFGEPVFRSAAGALAAALGDPRP